MLVGGISFSLLFLFLTFRLLYFYVFDEIIKSVFQKGNGREKRDIERNALYFSFYLYLSLPLFDEVCVSTSS